ncbi:MAG TPA: hypothetical protein VN783_15515 [Thermoanaerobaculia bacterium]|nr:hypothetical protein [Thermoanaerobaculia bacterium]
MLDSLELRKGCSGAPPERGAPALAPAAVDLCELGNKLAVFARFQRAGAFAGRGALPALAARARSLPAWESVWVVEGVAHAWTLSALAAGVPAARLLGPALDAIPRSCWLPLHTGLGLALGGRALDRAAAGADLGSVLNTFSADCRAAARPGYARAAFEGLGFAARTLRSGLVPAIDRALLRQAPHLAGAFWHGAGRGLYFVPAHALAGALPRAFAAAQREPPHELGRANAITGLAWALALVNLRHPAVLERALGTIATFETLANAPGARAAFAAGVSGAAAVWIDVRGREATFDELLAHRPTAAAAVAWRELVRDPARAALARQRQLAREGKLDALFAVPAPGRAS